MTATSLQKSGKLSELCQNLSGFLNRQLHKVRHGQQLDPNLAHDPLTDEYYTQKVLSCGLKLRANGKIRSSIVTLQIFIDPTAFNAWKEALGPTGMVYLDPYGIEIVKDKDTGRWGVFLDQKELNLALTAQAPYLAAELEIEGEISGFRPVIRTK